MSVEINPVAAAAAAQTSSYTPPQPAGTDDASGPDPRRYTKFDHSVTDAGTAHMTFGDFIDMINPLEHIPVISSVYRAVTGEKINPVSRVAGDILYGGVLGAASAVFGGVSAVADAGLEEQTGKDSGGIAIAMLFGPDDEKDKTTQLADAGNTAAAPVAPSAILAAASPPQNDQTMQLANAQNAGSIPATPSAALAAAHAGQQNPVRQNIEIAQAAPASPMIAALAVPANTAPTQAVAGETPALPSPQDLMAQASAAAGTAAPASIPFPPAAPNDMAAEPQGGISLANAKKTAKQPYGGVMAPALANSSAQEMALALSQGSPAMRMGNTIYANRLVNGSHPTLPILSSGGAKANGVVAPVPTVPAPVFTPVSASAPPAAGAAQIPTPALSSFPDSSLPAGLMQDMMLKAIGQYKGTAALGPGGGPSVNLLN